MSLPVDRLNCGAWNADACANMSGLKLLILYLFSFHLQFCWYYNGRQKKYLRCWFAKKNANHNIYHYISYSRSITRIHQQRVSNRIIKMKNSTFHNKDGKYCCDICVHQASLMGNLARHKSWVHEGVKFSCGRCDKQLTSQSNLVEHKRAVHEGVICPCR